MNKSILIGVIVGGGVGCLLGQLAVLFFGKEIFDWIDRVVDRVRGWFRLPPASF